MVKGVDGAVLYQGEMAGVGCEKHFLLFLAYQRIGQYAIGIYIQAD